MTKSELRKSYKKKRQQLSLAEIDQKSIAIANQTLALPIWEKAIYSIFLSIEKQKEINTTFLLSILQGKDKDIVVAKSDFSSYEMSHYLLTDNTKLKINPIGIPEPVDGIAIPPTKIDVVFIPLLAFDDMGNRIGYGKGFYDRFLSRCRQETLKIGLSFFESAPKRITEEDTDIPLDFCVTPQQIYSF